MLCFTYLNFRISNGTMAYLHSITLDPRENDADIRDKIRNARPGDIICLKFPPLSVNVRLAVNESIPLDLLDSLSVDEPIVPIFMRTRSKYEPIRRWEVLHRIEEVEGIRYRGIGYDIGLACTFEKSQSKTLESVILDFNLFPRMSLAFEKVLVGFSRVKMVDDVRIMPLLEGQTFDHLFRLKPNPRMLCWIAGYGPDGIFDINKVRRALDNLLVPAAGRSKPKRTARNPFTASPKEKGPAPHSKPKPAAKGVADPSNVPADLPDSNSRKSKEQSSSSVGNRHLDLMGQSRVAVTVTFRLDRPIPQTKDKDFNAFFIAPDGDCMFTSVIQLLKLEMTVAALRSMVVDRIESFPVTGRIGAINEHMLRDPSWQNERQFQIEELVDAHGTAQEVITEVLLDPMNQSDVGSGRLVSLWTRYQKDMRSKAWAGYSELSAVIDIFSVNIIVWELLPPNVLTPNRTVRQISPVRCPGGSAKTLHLLLVNKKHYEITGQTKPIHAISR